MGRRVREAAAAHGSSPSRHAIRPAVPRRRAVRWAVRWMIGTAVIAGGLAACAAWLAYRAQHAQLAFAAVRRDGARLQQELSGYDLVAAGPALARLRVDAAQAHHLTSDPVWTIAAQIPFAGRRLRAAAVTARSLASITEASRPLETALPALDPAHSGMVSGFDPAALTVLAQSIPAVSAAISAGAADVGEIDVAQLYGAEAAGVTQLQTALNSARQPVADAVPVLALLPSMLGADHAKNWMVLLQQDAEARGTGGLIGAYAVLRTEQGRIQLVSATSRQAIDAGPKVPVTGMPASLRDLWGTDLTEWAGLNGSPDFAYTGRLVAAGWTARGLPALDYVAAIDPYTVAAMLSATGPVTVRGIRVSDQNAVRFLSRDVYARWTDPRTVDAVVTELVRSTFARFTTHRLDVPRLITAFTQPAQQRRLLVWAANAHEQSQLSGYSVSGTLPTDPGPFAMTVVNNGGGNKLDAYLKVHTDYQPGTCIRGQRVGWITVTLNNTAPRSGLPSYVTQRNDLPQLGLPSRHITGSNRVILDVYGPVSGQAAYTSLDGRAVTPITGIDSSHSVWRLYVPIDPGQKRTVLVSVLAPAVAGEVTTKPRVMVQPMAIPATTSTGPVTACQS